MDGKTLFEKWLSFVLIAGLVLAVGLKIAISAGNSGTAPLQITADGKRLTWVITGNTTGDCVAIGAAGSGNNPGISGTIIGMKITPDDAANAVASGDGQPANLFDITLLAKHLSEDVLAGLGANCGNTTVTRDCPLSSTNSMPYTLYNETLTPNADNMGNGGVCILEIILE